MKRKLLLSLALAFGATTLTMAQSKSTGDRTFVTGLTANLTLNNTTSEATLVLSGPTDRWFAFKLGSFTAAMSSGVDGVYWDGTTLKDANGGNLNEDATQNWTVLTNIVAGATRTITAKRAFSTGDASDYTIVYANANIDIAGAFADSAGDYVLASHGGNRAKFVDATFTVLGLDGKEIKDFVVHPNPTKNSFSIQTQEELSSIIVYNNIGKVVGTIKPSTGSYDISFLSNGIYFLEIQAISGKKSYEKIVKK
jgi:hypothetical protein